MAIGKDRAVLKPLRTLFNVGTIGDLTDGQLLERFAASHGEAAELAFAVLVERHGPMVLRVCQGLLVDPNDRDDAFQATFLVLVKKARALWVRDSLGPWLHQVAYRTASRARSTAARRLRHERQVAMSRRESGDDSGDELGRVLHEELARLPERYRAPLVLCDLEGCSHEQAARHLGWPVGTIKSRQARGRERLRDRLRRRGLAPDAGALATALVRNGQNALLSPSLVDSTTRAVVQYVTLPAIVQGSAASLAQEVLRSMLIIRQLKVASVLLALGATVSGAGLLAQRGEAGDPPRSPENLQVARTYDGPVHEVKPDKLKVSVRERGVVEAARSAYAFCMVDGTRAIIALKPEGSYVKKGDIVCELDSAQLKAKLLEHRFAKDLAEKNYQSAKRARGDAEVAAAEQVAAIYTRELETVNRQITETEPVIEQLVARQSRTQLARERFAPARAATKAARSPADIVAELDFDDRMESIKRDLANHQAALQLAKAKRDTLQRYITYDLAKTTKAHNVDVAHKHVDELAKQAAIAAETKMITRLEKQIAACKLVAAADGVVIHQPQIQEGATVRERQTIFSIFDPDGPMQVNTKVRELRIDQIMRNMKAQIRIDAFSDQVLEGTVVDVAPRPDAPSFRHSAIKVYTTKVRIDQPLPTLRPGMSAEVEIVIKDLDNVLTVPVQAVLTHDDKDQVAVKKPDGRFEWRDVTLGPSSDALVEVKQGIQSGEHVALDPLSLLTEAERARLNPTTWPTAKPARKRREVK